MWDEDLFAPADEDSRSTTQVDAFIAAQTAWLEANLAEGDCIIEMDEYYRPKLPKGAQEYYGRAGAGVFTAYSIEPRSGAVRETRFTKPVARGGSTSDGSDGIEPARKARPDLTAKGAAMVGDLRTDALHQALREKPVDDDQLIAMLVLALAGRNVTVLSGVTGRHRASHLGRIAETLTEGGAITRDLTTIRHAARETLVEALSCRENHSATGMGARYAGAAIGADTYLPNMATEEFLPALSRAALEQCAEASDVAKQVRVKDTRAAMVARFSEGTFVYPAARFAPTEAELEARRNPASMFGESGSRRRSRSRWQCRHAGRKRRRRDGRGRRRLGRDHDRRRARGLARQHRDGRDPGDADRGLGRHPGPVFRHRANFPSHSEPQHDRHVRLPGCVGRSHPPNKFTTWSVHPGPPRPLGWSSTAPRPSTGSRS